MCIFRCFIYNTCLHVHFMKVAIFHVLNTSRMSYYIQSSIFSAGVGRTGTYIALDALYREGQNTGKINVPLYVKTMRKDRMNMIQGEVSWKHNPKRHVFSFYIVKFVKKNKT